LKGNLKQLEEVEYDEQIKKSERKDEK